MIQDLKVLKMGATGNEDNMSNANNKDFILKKELAKMLNEFDNLCHENSLIYSVAYGTMLGCVRHEGFIPWDDDLDVFMPRKDYERLLALADKNDRLSENLSLYFYNNHKAFPFIKIVNRNINLTEEWIDVDDNYYGLWIDIFPLDKYIDDPKTVEVKNKIVNLYDKFRKTYIRYDHQSFFIKRILKNLRNYFYKSIYNRNKLCREIDDLAKIYIDEDVDVYSCFLERMYLFNSLETKRMKFEDFYIDCFADYDRLLTEEYGDWKVLPPVSERVNTHYIVRKK